MKTMEEEILQKNKELDNTKAEISSLNKKLEGKQIDKALDKQVSYAAIVANNGKNEQATANATDSVDEMKQKTVSLEQMVNEDPNYIQIYLYI